MNKNVISETTLYIHQFYLVFILLFVYYNTLSQKIYSRKNRVIFFASLYFLRLRQTTILPYLFNCRGLGINLRFSGKKTTQLQSANVITWSKYDISPTNDRRGKYRKIAFPTQVLNPHSYNLVGNNN